MLSAILPPLPCVVSSGEGTALSPAATYTEFGGSYALKQKGLAQSGK